MRPLKLTLIATTIITACLAARAATFVSSTPEPGASPVIAVCIGDQPEVVRIRLQHTPAPWDVCAPPAPIDRDAANGVAQLAFTEIPFGLNTLELLAADGSVRSAQYLEKWVTSKGDQFLRTDLTNYLFGATTRPDPTDLPLLAGAQPGLMVHRGEIPRITLESMTGILAAGTITFSCSHDGICAVWSGNTRIAARRPYRVGEVKTIIIDPTMAPADKPLTIRLENGYQTVAVQLAPEQVPGWPVEGARAPSGAPGAPGQPPTGGTETAGSSATGNLGNFVVTRCAVHTQPGAGGGRVKIEFAACARIVTPPQGDEPGVINTAGILSSGTWVRISHPGGMELKDTYVYRANDGTAVAGIARWRLENETAVFEGALTINAHGVSPDFITTLTHGPRPLTIAVTWGDDRMAWSPELIWSPAAKGAWEGTLAK